MRFGFVHCLLTGAHCLQQSATNRGTWCSNTLLKHCLKPFKNKHLSIYKAIGFTTKYFPKAQENPVLCNSKGTLTDTHRLTGRMLTQHTRPASTHFCPTGQPTAPPSPSAGHTAAGLPAGRLWCVWKGDCASSELPASSVEQVGSDMPKWLSVVLKQCSPTAANSSSSAGCATSCAAPSSKAFM